MPKIINHEERKIKTLESALKVINSSNRFSMALVADDMDISRTTLYNYYKSKKEMKKDMLDNFNRLTNETEKAKYILKKTDLPEETYMKIWESGLIKKEL